MQGADRLGITWLGHATVQVELAGVTVLTDPALTPRLAHLRRHETVDLERVVPPDVVLISHVHMDHLHVPSLRLLGSDLGKDVALIVPQGAGGLLRRKGFRNVQETRAGAVLDVGPLRIEVVPAVHPRRRGPHSRVAADPVGYVLRAEGGSVYFAGDTDLFPEMATWEPVDVALLPIWGWGPSIGEGHLDPTSAVRATELLAPGLVVPVHWGTYSPWTSARPDWLDAPAARFRSELEAAGGLDRLRLLSPGGGPLLLPPAATDSQLPQR